MKIETGYTLKMKFKIQITKMNLELGLFIRLLQNKVKCDNI